MRVVVGGGGLSGLVVARRLVERGADVMVLEASDRWGGRLDRHVLDDGTPLETGGQWIAQAHHHLLELVDELELRTFPTWLRGDSVLEIKGRRRRHHPSRPPLLREPRALGSFAVAAARLDRLARRPLPEHDTTTFGAWLDDHVRDPSARELWTVASGLTLGGAPHDVSLLFALEHVRGAGGIGALLDTDGGAQELRLVGGPSAMVDRLVDDLGERCRLESPIGSVVDHGDRVEVHHADGVEVADALVLAMSPTELPRIAFTPALPRPQQALVDRHAMATGLKVNVVYDRPFWRDDDLNGQSLSDVGPLPTTFDNSPPSREPGVLVGFASFDDRYRTALPEAWRDDPATRHGAYLDQLARLFGEPARRPREIVERDWGAEPWIGGCIPSAPPGLLTEVAAHWRTPHGRVVWAGTERSDHWNGYMEGAVESAERAVDEVVSLADRPD